LAARSSALKKEIFKDDLKYSHRHRLLDHLKKIGDILYPRRNRAVHRVSILFEQDVDGFVSEELPCELERLLSKKGDVKKLQKLSKQLGLNSKAFSHVRESLSGYWQRLLRSIGKQKKTRDISHNGPPAHVKQRIETRESCFLERAERASASVESVEALLDEAEELCLSNEQRIQFDQIGATLRDQIEGELSAEQLEPMRSLLLRQLEIWRRDRVSPSVDFALEMAYVEQIENEKNRLERIEQRIDEENI